MPTARQTAAFRDDAESALRISVEEGIEARFLPALGRLHWEEAHAVLHAVRVTGADGPPRRYGPDDPWEEPAPDPRRRYHRIGGVLKRRCVEGMDYDLCVRAPRPHR